ncbi:hypothetical protein BHM03_00022933 [Ensete ventricosum]|nr:hypothetical protein BHM03_00022933 [Ensete ventricosum]
MKNSRNDMLPLLPLQEFMSLTSIQGKLRASASCSIFYVNFLHAAWILHQVPPKLLRPSICIKLMVALAPTIPQVSPLLSPIFTSSLSVPSFDVAMVAPPHYLMRDHAMTRRSLGLLSFMKLLS